MPDRSSADVESIVREVRDPFTALRTNTELVRQLFAGTRDYATQIAAILGLTDKKEAQNKHHGGFVMTYQAVLSGLRIARTLSATQSNSTDRAQTENDNAEGWAGALLHALDTDLRQDGLAIQGILDGPFGVKLIGCREWAPPKRDRDEYPETDDGNKGYVELSDEYRKAHRRMTVRALDPLSIGFLEDSEAGGDGPFSIGVIDETVPLISVSGEGRDASEAKIEKALTDRFGNLGDLRTGVATASDSGESWWQQSVRRLIVWDRHEEQVWIAPYGTNSGWRQDKKHKRKNPFGRVPFVILRGYESPFASIGERYMGIMVPLARLYDALNMVVNLEVTMATRRGINAELDAEAIRAWADTGPDALKDAREVLEKRGITMVPGAITTNGDIIQYLRELGAYLTVEIEKAEQRMLSFQVSPDTPDNGTANIVLAKRNDGRAFYKNQYTEVCNGDAGIVQMAAHDITYGGSEFYKGDDKQITYRLSGSEQGWFASKQTLGDRSVPKDYFAKICDGRAQIVFTTVSDDESTKTLKTQDAMTRAAAGYATRKDVLSASGELDVTGKDKEITTEQHLQAESARNRAVFETKWLRHMARRFGAIDEAQIQQQVMLAQAAMMQASQLPGAQGNPEPQGMGGSMMRPAPAGDPVSA